MHPQLPALFLQPNWCSSGRDDCMERRTCGQTFIRLKRARCWWWWKLSHPYKLSFQRTLWERARTKILRTEHLQKQHVQRETYYIHWRKAVQNPKSIYPWWLMRGIKQNQLSQLGRANRFSLGRTHMCTQGYGPVLFYNFILFQILPNILSKPWMIRWRNKECIFRYET